MKMKPVSVQKLVKAIINQDVKSAKSAFSEVMEEKRTSALAAKKIAVAQKIYGN